MSLKGKIFELQKKLNILDVEQQNTEDFSFHPEITHYKLPNRKDDFINNLNQAEETRKDRFETLKKQLLIERSEDCSFAPQINRRKKDLLASKSQKPVFLRLTEKGKEYQDSAEKRKEMCKSHDFDGKRLFQPTSAQKPRVEKGNMQVEEYLFRDAKDRVEKMDIKRENEKKSLERVASKQKMNKHSALLVKRKCEREAREIFDDIQSCITQKVDEEATSSDMSELNATISSDHLTKSTIAMLKFFDHNKGNLSFHNSVSHATSPYEVSDKVWAMLDPNETNDLSLKMFLTIAIPVMVAGGSTDVGTANKGKTSDSKSVVLEPEKASYLYQYLSASHFYFNKKKKQEKENESLNAKKFVKKATKKSSKTGKAMSSSLSQATSVDDTDDTQSQAQSEVSDGISVSESLKSYKEKAAMSRKIQSYNKVLTDREILANNRLELLRESLIQKEMEECTFQPRISNTAHQLKAKEMANQSAQLDDASVSTVPVKVYDRLYAEKDTVPRSIAQDKHEHSSNRGLDECTFTPKLIHSQYVPFNHSTNTSSEYAMKNGGGKAQSGRRPSRMEKNIANFFGDLELESGNQRIFKPSESMGSSRNESFDNVNESPKASTTATSSAPRGYSDSIRRIREAAFNKKKKEAEDEAFFAVNEERYNNGLQIMAEGPKPFRFRTEERQSEKEKMYAEVMQAQGQDGPSGTGDSSETLPSNALESIRGKTKKLNGELKPVRLYVEIKLGAAKKSHIAIADFDIPLLLAKDFCKIYGLDSGAEQELSRVVESNMLANDIPIGAMLGGNQGLADDGASKGNRRSFADSATFSSNNLDEDDEEYTFYDGSVPQEQSVPLYDHPF